MFSPNPAPSTAGSGYTRARTPQGGMSPTALSALFPTAMTGEGLTATEVASQMVARMTSNMSKQGTKDVQYSCKTEEAKAWAHVYRSRVRLTYGPVGEKILSTEGFTLPELANLEPFQLEMVKCMDMHLYSHILACIDRTAMHGQSMMNTIMAKDEIIGSGHKLMGFIMGKTDNMSYEKAQLTLLEIGQMQINLTDEPEAMELVLSNMRHKWNSLPEKYRVDDMQLFDFMLKLYPPACDNEKKALEMHVRTSVSMGGTMPPYDAVAETIMKAILKKQLEAPATTLYTGGDNRNNGGGRGGRGGGNGGGRGGYGRGGGTRAFQCHNCGGNHTSGSCPTKCATCEFAFCGSKGDAAKCPCKLTTFPAQLLNFKGYPIPHHLYEKVKEVHKAKGGAPAGTTLVTDVWGGLTGNGYSGNGGISFTIHDEVETAQAVTEQMPTGSWYTTPPKWCAQCDENGDPTGEQVKDFFKCFGGNSQCERGCVCKDSREAGLTKCEACNDDFCVVHKSRRPLVTGMISRRLATRSHEEKWC